VRRGLWFAAGAGAGAYVVVRTRRLAEAFTGKGLADRWQALALGARLFRDEVAQGRAEAEFELRERFGLVPHGLVPPERAELVSSTTTPPPTRTRNEEGHG
jgi:Family of unknown function (DUF6167)